MSDYRQADATFAARTGVHASARSAFIARTYNHLFGAIITFTLLEIFFFKTGMAENIARSLLGVNWLLVLGGFVIVSWFASRAAHKASSAATQYLALGAFVVAEAIIFVPLLYIANRYAPGTITSAATVTLTGFAGLTFLAFRTRKNFSFLGGLLRWGLILAMIAIVAGVLFGFELGTWFSVAMVGLAGGAILFDTSKIIHDFPEDRHVAAALELFASVALMFWYVLRLFMGSRN
jgi:FtsH-binding integral membrane protein